MYATRNPLSDLGRKGEAEEWSSTRIEPMRSVGCSDIDVGLGVK